MTFTTRPELRGSFGAVASTHWLASASGMAVLERGGNAFDAACAAGFVLQVVEPHLNGPGGDLPAVFWSAERGEPLVLCAQGVSPAAATIDELPLARPRPRPGTGLLAACVPGSFAGWLLLLEQFGTWPLADVLEFAIGYAEHGYPVDRRDHDDDRARRAAAARVARLGRAVPARRRGPGTTFRNPFISPRRGGGCSTSRAADRVERRSSARGGLLRGLRRRRDRPLLARERRPADRRRHGAVARDARAAGDGRLPRADGLQDRGVGAGAVGRCSSCAARRVRRRVARRRPSSCTSSPRRRSSRSPTATRTTATAPTSRSTVSSRAEYADERRALIGEDASAELRPGLGRLPSTSCMSHHSVALGAGEPTRGDTVHLDVADRFGNLVSATPSGGWLQSSPTIPALGWPLGSRAQMFWLEEGLPSSLAPRQAAADDALAGARASRRRAVARLRHARRRPAGAVGAARASPARRPRARPAGGDRRTGVAHRPPDLVVRPARVRAALAARSSRASATR